ncbi:MAG TPA: hypothetical protein VFK89_08475, partial [Actinomycetota bacterium]|nr:hypothetical protein [Actinomycetota bacterium]
DTLVGGPDDDQLLGDQLENSEGTDFLNGGGGNDLLDGGDEAFRRDGSPSMDSIAGGTGNDTVDYHTRTVGINVTLDGANNDGELTDVSEQDNVATDVENVIGGTGNDFMQGSPIDNRFEGMEGDDFFIGGLGGDEFSGGAGVDAVSYEDRTQAVTVTVDGFPDDGETFTVDGRPTTEGDNVLTDIETIIGGLGPDHLAIKSAIPATLFGSEGNDILEGGSGPDQLSGEAGDDTIYAADGTADNVDGGEGKDTAQVDEVDSVAGVESFF